MVEHEQSHVEVKVHQTLWLFQVDLGRITVQDSRNPKTWARLRHNQLL